MYGLICYLLTGGVLDVTRLEAGLDVVLLLLDVEEEPGPLGVDSSVLEAVLVAVSGPLSLIPGLQVPGMEMSGPQLPVMEMSGPSARVLRVLVSPVVASGWVVCGGSGARL